MQVRVALVTGVQMRLVRLVAASTLTGISGLPETVKEKRSEAKPKAASRWTVGFQQEVGRPAKGKGQWDA